MNMSRLVSLALVAITGLVMAANALLWLIVPQRAADALKMPLLTGDALSSQMDIGAFFLGNAIFIAWGLSTREPQWFVAAGLLLFGAASVRTIAFLFHDATFLADMIIAEIVMGSVLFIASRTLTKQGDHSR